MVHPDVRAELNRQIAHRVQSRLVDPKNLYRIAMDPRFPAGPAFVLVRHHYASLHAPLEHYTHDQWIDMFARCGFAAGPPDPKKKLTIYRGCAPEYRDGMSWTLDLQIAADYARRRGGRHIYTMEITAPEAIYYYAPRPTKNGKRIVDQVLIDARGRDMELLDPSKHTVCIDPFTKKFHHRKKKTGDKPWRILPAGNNAFMEVAHMERKRDRR